MSLDQKSTTYEIMRRSREFRTDTQVDVAETFIRSNIYGEIMPPFVAHIAHRLKIGPSSSLIDLGAGVGNLVFQMSLATGCKSFGVEQMNAPADLAFAQLSEGRARSFMYGLSSGEMEFEKGDFCNSEKLSGKLPDTDVVLINNCEYADCTKWQVADQL